MHPKQITEKSRLLICIPGLDIEYSCRLPDELTIFSAEFTAIKLSLVRIKQNYERFEHRKNIAIFSDSLSTLTAIKTGKSFCRPKMLHEILQLINDIHVDVHLVWVPSHLGIEGNEKADRLTQNATRLGYKKISATGRRGGT